MLASVREARNGVSKIPLKIIVVTVCIVTVMLAAASLYVRHENSACQTMCQSAGRTDGSFTLGYFHPKTGAGKPSGCSCK